MAIKNHFLVCNKTEALHFPEPIILQTSVFSNLSYIITS